MAHGAQAVLTAPLPPALGRHRVTLLDTESEPLARWHAEQAGAQVLQAWRDLSIRFVGGETLQQVERVGQRLRITTESGLRFAADRLVMAAGLHTPPRLAQSAGLDWSNGIAVDAHTLQTSVAGIYALGDCISVEGQCNRFIKPIARQARTLAAALLGQPGIPYEHRSVVVRVKTSSHPMTLH